MRYDDDRNEYVLDSGRRFYAHGGVLGLGNGAVVDDDELLEGWDGHVTEYSHPFTPEERREIAAEMIRRWEAWAGKAR